MWTFFKRMVTNWKLWVFSALAAVTWGAIYYAVRWYKDDPSFGRSNS
jgi:hypothetical protein